jgi:hypothetical protein
VYLLIVVVLLVWAGIVARRRYLAKKDLEEIHAITQHRIRIEFGKQPVVAAVPARRVTPLAWPEPVLFTLRAPTQITTERALRRRLHYGFTPEMHATELGEVRTRAQAV